MHRKKRSIESRIKTKKGKHFVLNREITVARKRTRREELLLHVKIFLKAREKEMPFLFRLSNGRATDVIVVFSNGERAEQLDTSERFYY